MLAAPYYVPAQFSKGALPDGRATRAQQAERADVLSHDVQRMSPGGGDRSIRRRRVHPAQSGRRRRQAGVRRVLHANGRGVSGQARRVQAGDGGGPIRRAALLPGLARRWPVGGHGHLPLRREWQNRRTLGRAPEDSRAGGQREHDVLADDPVAPVDCHGPPIRESHQRFAHPPRLTGDLEGSMRTNWMASTIVSLTMLVGAAQAAAQTDFQWHNRLATGQTIEIKGINGDVRATASSSGEVEVTATRTARRGNPADVRIEVVPHSGGVTICAVYPTVPGRQPNRCEAGCEGRSNTRDNDTVVHFDV